MAQRRVFVDIGPLRKSVQFRRLFLSFGASSIGGQIVIVAIPYETYRLTSSTLDVGCVSLVELATLLVGALVGGSLADSANRRTIVLTTQVSRVFMCALLCLNARAIHPMLWPLFVIAGVISATTGAEAPARSAMYVNLLDRDDLVPANALWQLQYQFGMIIGPAVGGVLIARTSLFVAFAAAGGLAVVNFLGLLRVQNTPTIRDPSASIKSGLLEGIRFLRDRPALQGTFIVDMNAMIFGMPSALFPALALHRFHGGASTVGLLYAAPAIGAFLVASLMGWAASIRRFGIAVLISVAIWGVGIVIFGLTTILAVALVGLAIAGGADVVSAVFRNGILQTETPDELRGRLQGVQTAVVVGGPRLGNFEAGLVASASGSLEISVVSGGLACIAGVFILARAMPGFTRYRVTPKSDVIAQSGAGEEDEHSLRASEL